MSKVHFWLTCVAQNRLCLSSLLLPDWYPRLFPNMPLHLKHLRQHYCKQCLSVQMLPLSSWMNLSMKQEERRKTLINIKISDLRVNLWQDYIRLFISGNFWKKKCDIYIIDYVLAMKALNVITSSLLEKGLPPVECGQDFFEPRAWRCI